MNLVGLVILQGKLYDFTLFRRPREVVHKDVDAFVDVLQKLPLEQPMLLTQLPVAVLRLFRITQPALEEEDEELEAVPQGTVVCYSVVEGYGMGGAVHCAPLVGHLLGPWLVHGIDVRQVGYPWRLKAGETSRQCRAIACCKSYTKTYQTLTTP